MIHIAWFNGKYTFKKFRFELERLVSSGHYLYNFLFTHPHIFVNMHHVLVFWDYCLLLWLLKKLMKIRCKALYKQTAKMSKTNCFCFWHLPYWQNHATSLSAHNFMDKSLNVESFLRKANIEFWRFSFFVSTTEPQCYAQIMWIVIAVKGRWLPSRMIRSWTVKGRWLSNRGTINPIVSHDIYIHQMRLFRLCRAV